MLQNPLDYSFLGWDRHIKYVVELNMFDVRLGTGTKQHVAVFNYFVGSKPSSIIICKVLLLMQHYKLFLIWKRRENVAVVTISDIQLK